MAADIRPARASDVHALLAIESAVFHSDRLSRRSFRHLVASPSAAVLVALADGKVAGYCVLLFRAGVPAARLYSIATAADFEGRGIGRSLIEASEREAAKRGRRSLRLEVREDNSRAIAIYRRVGFEPIGREPGYYQDDMAAIRLEKRLGKEAPKSAGLSRGETFGASGSFSRLAEKIPRRASP